MIIYKEIRNITWKYNAKLKTERKFGHQKLITKKGRFCFFV